MRAAVNPRQLKPAGLQTELRGRCEQIVPGCRLRGCPPGLVMSEHGSIELK